MRKMEDQDTMDKKISCAIFDVDGTLLDSMGVWINIGDIYLRKKGYEPDPELAEKVKVMTVPLTAAYMKETYHMPETAEEITREIEDTVKDFYYYQAEDKQDARAYMKKLYDQGTRIFVATASERDPIEHALARVGMWPMVEQLFTSSELGCGKSQDGYWALVASKIGVPVEDMTIFEDSLHAVETAVQAGCTVVAISDRYTVEDEPALRKLADRYIYNFTELL